MSFFAKINDHKRYGATTNEEWMGEKRETESKKEKKIKSEQWAAEVKLANEWTSGRWCRCCCHCCLHHLSMECVRVLKWNRMVCLVTNFHLSFGKVLVFSLIRLAIYMLIACLCCCSKKTLLHCCINTSLIKRTTLRLEHVAQNFNWEKNWWYLRGAILKNTDTVINRISKNVLKSAFFATPIRNTPSNFLSFFFVVSTPWVFQYETNESFERTCSHGTDCTSNCIRYDVVRCTILSIMQKSFYLVYMNAWNAENIWKSLKPQILHTCRFSIVTAMIWHR